MSSRAEPQRKTAKMGNKLLLVYSKPVHCQVTLLMQNVDSHANGGEMKKRTWAAHNCFRFALVLVNCISKLRSKQNAGKQISFSCPFERSATGSWAT